MSWSDYTHAKHFGSGIYRPYSDFLADVLVQLDNRLAADPPFARTIVPLSSRDTIVILGDAISVICISSTSHRHYPFFSIYKWGEFWTTPEPQLVTSLGLHLKDTQQISLRSLDEHLQKDFSFLDHVVFSVPSVFQAPSGTTEFETRARSVSGVANLLWLVERKHYEERMEMDKPKEIFLSHKSTDKTLVREIAKTLSMIGYAPWLDEDKMKAGANLERALREGFSNSCAAVFFVTPNFIDEGYLSSEIDYALAEKRSKGDRFAIITLLLSGPDGSVGTVPKMIQQYVWKQVEPIEITRTILESLPIRMDRVVWRH